MTDLHAVQALGSALLANRQGLYNQALAHAKTAHKEFAKGRNVPGELQSRFEEVYALRSMLLGHDCLDAAVALQKGLARTRYHWLQAQVFIEQSQCRNFKGESAAADRDSKTSLAVADQYDFRIITLRVIGIDAGIKRQEHRYDESWKESARGAGLYWQGAYPAERLDQFYAVMWQCASDSGYPHTAEALLRRTLEIRASANNNMPRNQIREATLKLHLKNILMANGETALAEQEKDEALSQLEGASESYVENFVLSTELDPAEHLLQQHDAELALTTLKPVEKMLESTQDNFFALRFYRLLGNIYLHLKKLDEASVAYKSAIQVSDVSLRNLRSLKDRLAWLRATGDSYRGLVRVLLEQKKKEEALARWELYKSRTLLHSVNLESELATSESWAQLGPQQSKSILPPVPGVHIIYAAFEDGLQTWIYQGRRVLGKWTAIPQAELQRKIQEFVKQCSSPRNDLDTVNENAEKLYAMIVQPIAADLPQKGTLAIELDRSMSGLPFGALRGPSSRYLEDKYSIVYSPGIWMEKTLRPVLSIAMHDPTLLVDASRSTEMGSLPGASQERKTITDLFDRTTIIDSGDTRWEDWRSKLAGSEIFVFLGHGRPEGSGEALVLNSKESLSAKDFSQAPLSHIKLAVLSACSTGIEREEGLLDAENLVRSFLAAGVSSVIASQWNVDSESTAKLMSSFYRHLQQEKSVVRAMAQARKETLRDMPHPYYWAAFSLVGRAD